MTWVSRTGYVMVGTTANAIQALLYFRIFVAKLTPLATETYAGPFSFVIGSLDALWAAEIVIIQVALFAFWIYGGVREEKARAAVVRR